MFYDIIYLLLLLSSVIILIENRLHRVFRFLTFQGILLVFPLLQVLPIEEIHTHILILLTLIFKAFLSPYVLFWITEKKHLPEATNPRIGSIATSFFLLLGLVVTVTFANKLSSFSEGIHKIDLIYVFLMIYTGMLTLIIRTHWIALITGFVIFENGAFILSLLLRKGLPFGIELGTFIDALMILVAAITLKSGKEEILHEA
ncbi:MAG: formate hydrogenase [Leptospiraceae bacterium]|nr:formate hydrogenase [Leptospiraceae bacterium]